MSAKIENGIIKNSLQEKTFRKSDRQKANFQINIENLCQKTGQKLQALAKSNNYMDISKKYSVINVIVFVQF